MMHCEWADAKQCFPEVHGPFEFEDAYGTENEEPVLLLGNDSIIAIEGSIKSLQQLVLDIQKAIDNYVERDKLVYGYNRNSQ